MSARHNMITAVILLMPTHNIP